MTTVPLTATGIVAPVIDGDFVAHSATSGGTTISINMATGASPTEIGRATKSRFTDLSNAMKDVEVWLPHSERIELQQLRLERHPSDQDLARRRGLPR